MSRDTRTRAQKMRAERQEQLREYLSSRELVRRVLETADQLEEAPRDAVPALKAAADIRLALIKKYLPDLKASEIELTGGGGGPVEWTVLPVASNTDSREASPDPDDPKAA